jgi:arginyl-tRNA synthetase
VARESLDTSVLAVSAKEERALALVLLQFDSAVHDTIDKASPHRLCTYLYEVATAFTGFYENCPVLKSEEPVRSSRLVLCDATARVLRTGLGLLGIDAPEAM